LERRDGPLFPGKCSSSGGNALGEVYKPFVNTPSSLSEMALKSGFVLDIFIALVRLNKSG